VRQSKQQGRSRRGRRPYYSTADRCGANQYRSRPTPPNPAPRPTLPQARQKRRPRVCPKCELRAISVTRRAPRRAKANPARTDPGRGRRHSALSQRSNPCSRAARSLYMCVYNMYICAKAIPQHGSVWGKGPVFPKRALDSHREEECAHRLGGAEFFIASRLFLEEVESVGLLISPQL
jgi:hypothetical protein